MDKIRINKDDVYKIEVNDNGEYIEIDLLDIELSMKVYNLGKNLEKQTAFYNKKVSEIEKEYKNKPLELFLKKNKTDKDYCNKLRNEFDKVLGEGACQKIFGNTNRIGMFDELFKQLMPIFERIVDDIPKVQEKLMDRYMPKNEGRL